MDINSKCLTKIINYCTKSEYICHQRIPSSEKLKCTDNLTPPPKITNIIPNFTYKNKQNNSKMKKAYLFIYNNLHNNLQ